MNRFPRCNLHTHTNFCDGKDTPKEIVLAAIDAGLKTIGFSGHSYVHFDLDCCMTREQTEEYRREILRLRETYGKQIQILLGIEQDYYADDPAQGFDFVIGSVHYLPDGNEYFSVDETPEILTDAVNRCYGGDVYRLLAHYYETVADIAQKTGCQIVGHLDLISKFNENDALFCTEDPRALKCATDAIDTLLKKDVIFEINTGAIARGYRKAPYPAKSLLRYIVQKGGRLTLSSDAHDKKMLTFGFEDAVNCLQNAGGRSLWTVTADGWTELPI